MARKANNFKIIGRAAARFMVVRRPALCCSYELHADGKPLVFRRLFRAVTFRTSTIDAAGPSSRQQKEVVMTRLFHQDPTEFFTVVGAPYVREHHQNEQFDHRTGGQRPDGFPIGAASVFAAFCMVVLGVSLFASNGAANLFEVATYTVK
jgi:hypothetical protein